MTNGMYTIRKLFDDCLASRMTSRRPAYTGSPGGCRIEYHLEQEGHMLESDGPSEEDWDMVFDSYLLSDLFDKFNISIKMIAK